MRENYTLHKLHSLTGIIPVGYYLVQHLALNTFTLAGPQYFNGVIHFFEGIPKHLFYPLKFGVIWGCLLFHAIYGIFIVHRASPNLSQAAYKFRENGYYTWQRITGIVAFFFLCIHMGSTSVATMAKGSPEGVITYEVWADKLSANFYLLFIFYVIGIAASSFHFSYGLWHFCIRWGLTINEKAQETMGKVAKASFVLITLMGIGALTGFFLHKPEAEKVEAKAKVPVVSQMNVSE